MSSLFGDGPSGRPHTASGNNNDKALRRSSRTPKQRFSSLAAPEEEERNSDASDEYVLPTTTAAAGIKGEKGRKRKRVDFDDGPLAQTEIDSDTEMGLKPLNELPYTQASGSGESDDASATSMSDDDSDRPRNAKKREHITTWRSRNAEPLFVGRAFQQGENGDLARHLFNLFSLRRSLAEEGKEVREEDTIGADVASEPDPPLPTQEGEKKQKRHRPPSHHERQWPPWYWAAWPMESKNVPRSDEAVWGKASAQRMDDFNIRAPSPTIAGSKGRPVLSQELEDIITSIALRRGKMMWNAREILVRRARRISDADGATTDATEGVVTEGQASDGEGDRDVMQIKKEKQSAKRTFDHDAMELQHEGSAPEETSKDPIKHFLHDVPPPSAPIFTADDDAAHDLLYPQIRTIIADLDRLLFLLHQTSQFRVMSSWSPHLRWIDSKFQGLKTPGSIRKGGSQKKRTQPEDPADSDAEFIFLMHSDRLEPAPTGSLRDWRDLLGMAALNGWNSNAVQRAADRCSDLFGDEFEMETLEEAPFRHHVKTQEMTDSDENNEQVPIEKEGVINRLNEEPERHYFCPNVECTYHYRPFTKKRAWFQHLKAVHNLSKAERSRIRRHEEYHGAVHTDGFLEPLTTTFSIDNDELRQYSQHMRKPRTKDHMRKG